MTRNLSNFLLYPAVTLMNRLSFYKKFAILGLITLIAICVTLFSFYIQLNLIINNSRQESEGLAIIKPLVETIQLVQQHRGLSSAIVGGASELEATKAIRELAAEMAFNSVESRLPASTKQRESWKLIKSHWQDIRREGLQWDRLENFSKHTQLIDEMLVFVTDINDDYGLTADAHLDTFYLGHTASGELLHALEQLGQLRAYGTGALVAKQLTEAQKIQLKTLIERLKDTLTPLRISIEKAAHYNPEIQQPLLLTYENIQKTAQQVIDEVSTDVLAENFAIKPESFFEITTIAINEGYVQFYQSMLPTVDELLQKRIQRTTKRLLTTAGITCLFLLLVIYFMAAIYKTTLSNIRIFSKAVSNFVGGDLTNRVQLKTHDELKQIADSFNAMADEIVELFEIQESSKNQLKATLDAIPDSLFEVDEEGRFHSYHVPRSELTPIQLEQIVGKKITEVLPTNAAQVFLTALQEAQQYSKSAGKQFKLTAAEKELWFELSVAIKPITEQKSHFVVLSRDITERKQTETKLRIAAAVFEAQEGMTVTDANGRILQVNKAFTQVTGYTAEEVIGKNPNMRSSGRHDAAFYAAMWERINNTGVWEGEIWNRRKNGECYPEYLIITAVKNENGNITNYVATFNDITLSKATADKIEQLAYYDPLTGLPNRRRLYDRLKPVFAASHRSKLKGALLFIDMDNFKNLNDSLGHDMGDLLLKQVALRLLACVRENDMVVRLGGDEFVVMLEGLSDKTIEAANQAEIIGEKILATLNQPYQLAAHLYHSTPSIGVSFFSGHEQSADDILRQADIAMYQAKWAGRNTLRFFDPNMQIAITERVSLEKDLRQALAENQFTLYYQAQVRHGLQIIGAEALIRWQHPLRGLVSPYDFISLAEETNLIIPIGQWVLETACAQLKRWENCEHKQPLQLAVNVSARQFHQADFVAQVIDVINRHAINPDRLKLELTETLMSHDIDETISKMNALREIGVRFSMDDFGTGYSSLSNLKKLPIDQLKIDQSFVRDILTDPDDATIIQTIIAMAKNLGLKVIAEGVETEEQRIFLEQHNCPHFQGYLFSKPIPIEQFESLISSEN